MIGGSFLPVVCLLESLKQPVYGWQFQAAGQQHWWSSKHAECSSRLADVPGCVVSQAYARQEDLTSVIDIKVNQGSVLELGQSTSDPPAGLL